MIEAINFETAHLAGDALPAMFRLRHQVFIEREGYDVPSYNRMEWDQFDNPATHYLLRRDEHGHADGVARLIPTTERYMVKELWPELVNGQALPSQPDVWELTRVGVRPGLDAAARRRVHCDLICGFFEFGLIHGISSYLMVTHMRIIREHFANRGHSIRVLGAPMRLGRVPVCAARLEVSHESLARVRRDYGVVQPALRLWGETEKEAA
jgi:N-acyl-L-homoserine lactone synthetase